ncbi:hypothetical protein P4358_27635 [Bacillus thuringiensis]|nr:hypothetical protein [Bacillus thuringiensis]
MSNEYPQDSSNFNPFSTQSLTANNLPYTPNFHATNFVETTVPVNTKASSLQNPESKFPVQAAVDGISNIVQNHWRSNSTVASMTVIFPSQINLIGIKLIMGNAFPAQLTFKILVEKYSSNTGTFEVVNGNGNNFTVPANAALVSSDYIFIPSDSYEIMRISYQNIENFSFLAIHELLLLQTP